MHDKSDTPQTPDKPADKTASQPAAATADAPEVAIPLHRERPSWVTLVVPAIVLIALTVGIYLPALHGPFVFDDVPMLVGQEGVITRALANPRSLLQGGRPLSDASYALNALLTGKSPESLRLVNVALHILAGLLLLDLVRRTLASPRFNMRWVELATPLATVIAGLWLMHPLQTQAVSYVAQRGEIMATLFMFLSLDALAMVAGGGRCASLVKAVVVLSCVAAMLSKQVGYMLPVLLVLYDRTFWSMGFKQSFKLRPVLYAGVLLTLIIPWFMGVGGLFGSQALGVNSAVSAGFGTRGFTAWTYFFSEQTILVHYLQLVFWPGTLVLDYRYGLMEPAVFASCPIFAHVLCLSIMVALGVLTLWSMWRLPAWGFLGAWFFLLLGPTSSFLPIADLAMEHRMYGPIAAVISAAVMAVTMLLLWAARSRHCPRSNARLVGMLLVLVVFGALAVRTTYRNMDYASAMRLWGKVHQDRPTNTRAMLVLGKLIEPRDPQQALALYQQAARIEPDNYEPMIALGSFYLIHNQPDNAAKWYEVSHRLSGDELTYLLNMGLVADAKHDLPAAAHYLTQAMVASPGNLKILTNLGMVLDQLATQRLMAGDVKEALVLRQKAVSSQKQVLAADPSSPQARVNLATAMVNLGMQAMLAGDGQQAREALEQSLRVQPRGDTARRLAWLQATWPVALTDDWGAVVSLAQQAQAANEKVAGRQPLYMETTAAALARAGRYDEAAALQQQAIDVAQKAGLPEQKLAQSIKRLALYKQNKAYLNKPEPPATSSKKPAINTPAIISPDATPLQPAEAD